MAACLGLGPIAASALQFTLSGNERINQFATSLPGTSYNTDPGAVDYDQIGSTDPHPGELQMSGYLPSLNYHTTAAPGTSINQAFGTPLEFTLEAELLSATLTPAGGTFVTLELQFGGTADGAFDLVLTDPTDPGNVLLNANLVAGTLGSNPVAAITARATFDSTSVNPNLTMQTFAFFQVVSGAYANLFADTGGVGGFDPALTTGAVFDFEIGDLDLVNDFDDIVAAFNPTLGAPSLISSNSEASGSVFSVDTSAFQPVPEPTTALLLGAGLMGLALARARDRREH